MELWVQWIMVPLGLTCLWAIVAPKVHTGVAGTIGLLLIFVACIAVFDQSANPYKIVAALGVGFLLVLFGVLLQWWRARQDPDAPRRRASDQLDVLKAR